MLTRCVILCIFVYVAGECSRAQKKVGLNAPIRCPIPSTCGQPFSRKQFHYWPIAPWFSLAYEVRGGAPGRGGRAVEAVTVCGVCLARYSDSCGRIFQLGIRKKQKYVDALCNIVYICVCSGGMFPRSKKGRSKMKLTFKDIPIDPVFQNLKYEGIGTLATAKKNY